MSSTYKIREYIECALKEAREIECEEDYMSKGIIGPLNFVLDELLDLDSKIIELENEIQQSEEVYTYEFVENVVSNLLGVTVSDAEAILRNIPEDTEKFFNKFTSKEKLFEHLSIKEA